MTLEIVTVPCRTDNYAYLLRDGETGKTGLVDAPEAAPVIAALAERGWGLDLIMITHHHDDHVAAVEDLRRQYGAQVAGAAADRRRLPRLDIELAEDDTLSLGASVARVFEVPGHTVGHIAFYFPDDAALFTADSLMALGCGRLFEGTPEQMWSSLSKLAALPGETLVHSGHEYTESNARFALSVDPDNADLAARADDIARVRARGEPTVPSRLDLERATNPFLRAGDKALKSRIGMSDADDERAFAEIRRLKDSF